MRSTLLVLVGLAAFGALLWQGVRSQSGYRCEVCVRYEGRRACGRVAASSVEDARARARAQACSIVTTGVTETLACERRPVESQECTEP